jgi:D-alanyl-D-alanine carboxypeptidase
MMDDARAEGLEPLICSSYRTQEKQQELYDKKVNYYLEQGYEESVSKALAAEVVTYPGMSEHQLGLAVDICSVSNQELDSSQEDTATQQWLMENCYKYGYILRYPKDKVDITGISYEPWHYRYVGKEAAQEIYDKGLCLEEYAEQYIIQ